MSRGGSTINTVDPAGGRSTTNAERINTQLLLSHEKAIAGIIVDFGKKKALKKSTLPREKKHIFSKIKHPFHKQKALLEQKKALSKHYLLTKSNKKLFEKKMVSLFSSLQLFIILNFCNEALATMHVYVTQANE